MINEILKFDNQNYFWLKIARKIARIKRVYFVPISKNILPKKNYPLKNLNNFFRKQLLNFQNKQFNFNKNLYKILSLYFKKNSTINLLDYGGENLDLYMYLIKNFPKIQISVLNQPKLSDELKKIIKEKKIAKINVFSNINQIKKKKFNFIFFGSSIQYLRNYEDVIDKLSKNTNKFLYISATSYFNDKNLKKKLVVKQVNLLPIILYCYIFNFHYFAKMMDRKNFKILFKQKNEFKKISFNNFEFKIDHLNILFKKN